MFDCWSGEKLCADLFSLCVEIYIIVRYPIQFMSDEERSKNESIVFLIWILCGRIILDVMVMEL